MAVSPPEPPAVPPARLPLALPPLADRIAHRAAEQDHDAEQGPDARHDHEAEQDGDVGQGRDAEQHRGGDEGGDAEEDRGAEQGVELEEETAAPLSQAGYILLGKSGLAANSGGDGEPGRRPEVSPSVVEFGRRLASLDGVIDLLVAGSLATGDYVAGVSDLDLVALTSGPVSPAALTALHRDLDAGVAAGDKLGCVYVPVDAVPDRAARHPTWTHGRLVDRILSGVTRAELARYGFAIFGRAPAEVFPPVSAADIRDAAVAELTGYWAWAARRPWIWLDPEMAELGLTSMARGRHALRHGELLTKSEAIRQCAGPPWLRAHLAARRRGDPTDLPPRRRTAWLAWRDARRTVAEARRAPRTDTESRRTDTEARRPPRTDTEAHHTDTEAHHTNTEARRPPRTDTEAHHTDTEVRRRP